MDRDERKKDDTSHSCSISVQTNCICLTSKLQSYSKGTLQCKTMYISLRCGGGGGAEGGSWRLVFFPLTCVDNHGSVFIPDYKTHDHMSLCTNTHLIRPRHLYTYIYTPTLYDTVYVGYCGVTDDSSRSFIFLYFFFFFFLQ